jgi:hypothetical protein
MDAVARKCEKQACHFINNYVMCLYKNKAKPVVENNHQDRIASQPIHPIIVAVGVHGANLP